MNEGETHTTPGEDVRAAHAQVVAAAAMATVDGGAAAPADVTWYAGPDGLVAVVARVPGAPVMRGVRAAVVGADGHRYAHWTGRDVAALARSLGFHGADTVASETMAFMLEFALWDGLEGLWRPGRAADVTCVRAADAWTVGYEASGGLRPEPEYVEVKLPLVGSATVTRRPAAHRAQVQALTPALAVTRALADDDGSAVARALAQLPAKLGAAELDAVAAVAVRVPGMVGADAVMRLGDHAGGLDALKRALAGGGQLTGDALAVAEDLWGADAWV